MNSITWGLIPSEDVGQTVAYPLSRLRLTAPAYIKYVQPYPKTLIDWHNQGETGMCVGYSFSWNTTIRNTPRDALEPWKYDAEKLYVESRRVGGYPDPLDVQAGSTLDYACNVLRNQGHWKVSGTVLQEHPDQHEGILKYVWGTSVDDIRTAIHNGLTVVLGIGWTDTMMSPFFKASVKKRQWWIGLGEYYWKLLGGHAIACVGCDDEMQAVALLNTWGPDWCDGKEFWFSYQDLEALLKVYGEIAVVTDMRGPLPRREE